MDGSSGRPFASGSTVATPLRTVATSELVVPRSMPTARRCSCGAEDCPGSEICSNAILLFDRLVGRIDFFFDFLQEHELADLLDRSRIVLLRVDRLAQLRLQALRL